MRALLALLLALPLAAQRLAAAELLVHAAASLTGALREVAALHERETGDRVLLSLGASSLLARQLVAGAPGDLFFPADEASLDAVERRGLLAAGTRRSLLSNRLVVVVARDGGPPLSSAGDLLGPRVAAVAVAEPHTVPAGIYAREALSRLGVWERLLPKLVPTDNVRAALSALESGDVDAALVYRTDARISTRARVALELPHDPRHPVSYPAALLAGSREPVAARRLLDFLSSERARAVFRRHGFLTREAP